MSAVPSWQPSFVAVNALKSPQPIALLRFGAADEVSLSSSGDKTLSKGQQICIGMIDWYQKITRQSKLAARLNRQATGILGCGYKDRGLSGYSCSEYTREAIIKYGVLKGIFKGFCRILMCNPLTFRLKALQKYCIAP
jgi:hypothetical protein